MITQRRDCPAERGLSDCRVHAGSLVRLSAIAEKANKRICRFINYFHFFYTRMRFYGTHVYSVTPFDVEQPYESSNVPSDESLKVVDGELERFLCCCCHGRVDRIIAVGRGRLLGR